MKILFNSVKIDDADKKDYCEEEKEYEETIRLEEEKDYLKVENLVRDAFWNVYRPGAYEHYIVHNLRNDSSFIKDLAYILEESDEIIGSINYSNGKLNLYKKNRYGVDIKLSDGSGNATVLGPIAIDSKCQKKGYGSKLIGYTLNLAEEMGIPFVFVIGDEDYYSRFGFESASKYNIYLEGTDIEDENPFFMIKILDGNENILNDLDYEKGIFHNPEVFDVDEKYVDEFDKNFEYKEKKTLEGQLDI